ncbi:putative type IV secretion system protein [Roseibium sp. TrichSKD4]|nr:putative type IV secretion system protein [Roseibium sp. TrichSKD4]
MRFLMTSKGMGNIVEQLEAKCNPAQSERSAIAAEAPFWVSIHPAVSNQKYGNSVSTRISPAN